MPAIFTMPSTVLSQSHLGGPVIVVLGSPFVTSEIRYTMNGKNPTNTSLPYTSPLVFTQNATGGHTTVKARIYSKVNSNMKGKIIKVGFRVIRPG